MKDFGYLPYDSGVYREGFQRIVPGRLELKGKGEVKGFEQGPRGGGKRDRH